MCFYVSACAAIKLKLFSLSLSFSLSCASTSYQTSDAKESRCVSLCFFFSLSETPKGTQTSFFFLLGAATGVLRAIFGAFLGWAQALVAYGRYARRRKSSESSGVRTTTGDIKKYALAARRSGKRFKCIFSGKPRRETNSRSIDRSIDRSKVVSLRTRERRRRRKIKTNLF